MGNVFVGLSISLDGFIAGANDGPDNPLGDGGGRLFEWMHAGPERNRSNRFICPPDASLPVVQSWHDDCGAMISGRRTFDIAGGWADGHPIDVPNFVITHEVPTEGRWSPQVRFVTEGVERAVEAGEGGGRRPRRVGLRRQHRPAAAPGRAAGRDRAQRGAGTARLRRTALRTPRRRRQPRADPLHPVRRRHPPPLPHPALAPSTARVSSPALPFPFHGVSSS
jgi:hypothetical protein